MNTTAPSLRLKVTVFLLLVAVWGSTWLAIKIGLDDYPVFLSLAGRFLLAAAIFFAMIWIRRIPIPWGAEFQKLYAAVAVLSFVMSYASVYWAEQYITSGLAAVLFALFPILTAIISGLMLRRESFGPRRWLGLVLALGGVVAINFADLKQIHPLAPTGALVALIAPLVSAVSLVYTKSYVHRLHPYVMAGVPMLYAGLLHAVLWLVLERDIPLQWSWTGVGTIVYLSVLGSVLTFGLYYWLLQHMSAGRISLLAYLTPAFAVSLGYLVRSEPVSGYLLTGAAMILGGVGLAGRRSKPKIPEAGSAGPIEN